MPRPTIQTVKNRMLANIRASLGLVAQARRTLIGAFSDAISAQIYLLYTYADNLFNESHPLDAMGTRLDEWGQALAVSRQPATFARLQVTVTGLAGSRIDAETELRSNQGNFYLTEETVTIPTAGTLAVNIRSRDLGEDQNLQDGDMLNFTSAISGIENQVTVSDVLVEASDVETDIEYRERIVQFFKRVTWQAGGIDDYIAWALVNQNVRYAWVAKELNGISNQVGIFVLKEDDELLTAQEQAEVQGYINARAPVTARPLVQSPTKQAVPFNISIRENSTSVQREVENNLKELFARSRVPRGTIASNGAVGTGIIYISQIREAVSQAAGEEDNVINSPTSNLIPDDLYGILTLGEITFGDLVS